ncbi:MAG: hypothetical protein P8X74_03905 [Reinekea sp.]
MAKLTISIDEEILDKLKKMIFTEKANGEKISISKWVSDLIAAELESDEYLDPGEASF